MFRRSRQGISNQPDQPSGNEPALGGRGAELAQSPRLGGSAGLLHTLEALTDEDWQVRMRAVDALGQMSSEQVLTSLAEALRDSSQHVREHAADALGRMGSNEALNILLEALKHNKIPNATAAKGLAHFPRREAIEQLVLALGRAYQGEKQMVIDALVQIGSMATPWLIEALHHSSGFVVSGALEALGQIGGRLEDAEERGRYFDAIVPLMAREDSQVRNAAYLAVAWLRDLRAIPLLTSSWSYSWNFHYNRSAMRALGEMGELAVPTILEGLLSEDQNYRRHASEAFQFVSPHAVASLVTQIGDLSFDRRRTLLSNIRWLNEPAVAVLRELLSSQERPCRLTAAAILSAVVTLRPQERQMRLETTLQHPDPEVRYVATMTLANAPRRSLESTHFLVELTQDADRRVRVAALRALRRQRQGGQALFDALSDEQFGVRLEAVRALGKAPSVEGVQALIGILRGPERELHAAAAEALWKTEGDEVVSVLIEAIGPSYTTSTRRKAARSLGEKHSPRGVAPLLATIADPNHNVRVVAARALSKLVCHLQSQDHAAAIEALRDGLVHADPVVRLHAAYNLGYLGDAAAATILKEALTGGQPTPYLNTAAIDETLNRIH